MHLLVLVSFLLSSPVTPEELCGDSPSNKVVASIEFEGSEQTQTWVVQNHIQHEPGLRFSCEVWVREKTALENLDIFATVDLNATTTAKGLELRYQFVELPPFFAFPAIKATDQQGPLT